jgi:hypothetical protein
MLGKTAGAIKMDNPEKLPLITSLTLDVNIANLALNDNHSLSPIRYMYL